MLVTPSSSSLAWSFEREGECANNPFPDTNPGPGSLKRIRPLEPPNLGEFVKNKQAAIALGKALFWDMQVGSDGIQSCATCHFRAGADPRSKNQLAPGGVDNTRQVVDLGLNHQLVESDFPLHKLADVTDRKSRVIRSVDDVVSSQGVKLARFHSAERGESQESRPMIDSVFNIGGKTRRSEPRNTPTVINAAFNRRQFWDGRADEIFNGVNPFGGRDPNARVIKITGRNSEPTKVRIPFAAAASQAVGPPLSDLEMGFANRHFKDVGKRLLSAIPLAKQVVAADDSVRRRLLAQQTGRFFSRVWCSRMPRWSASRSSRSGGRQRTSLSSTCPATTGLRTFRDGRCATTNTPLRSSISLFLRPGDSAL